MTGCDDNPKKTAEPGLKFMPMIPTMPSTQTQTIGGRPDDLEVEVYYRVNFRIKTWDGQLKEHEADLPGHVTIKDLKEELQYELGDPKRSDWIIARTQIPMADDTILHNTYAVRHRENIEVLVHKPFIQRE